MSHAQTTNTSAWTGAALGDFNQRPICGVRCRAAARLGAPHTPSAPRTPSEPAHALRRHLPSDLRPAGERSAVHEGSELRGSAWMHAHNACMRRAHGCRVCHRCLWPAPTVKTSPLACASANKASATDLGDGIAVAAHAADTQKEADQAWMGTGAGLVMRGGDIGRGMRGTRLHSRRHRPQARSGRPVRVPVVGRFGGR